MLLHVLNRFSSLFASSKLIQGQCFNLLEEPTTKEKMITLNHPPAAQFNKMNLQLCVCD